MKEIKKKVNNGTYPNTEVFAADIHLMLDNAMTYVSFRLVSRFFRGSETDAIGSPVTERGRKRESCSEPAILAIRSPVYPQVVYEDARLLRETFNAAYARLTFGGQPRETAPAAGVQAM